MELLLREDYNLTKGETIEPSQTVSDLGVLLPNDCSWMPYIYHMLNTATKKLWSSAVSSVTDHLFKTMVSSSLEYCCPVWNPSKITEPIERV